MRNRSQPFDATFGTSVTDPVTFREERLKQNGDIVVMRERLPARHQKSVFDDSKVNRYWDKRNPWGSAKVAGSDTRITVLYETSTGSRVDLRVVFE